MSDLLDKIKARVAARGTTEQRVDGSLEKRVLRRCAKKDAAEYKRRGEIALLLRLGTNGSDEEISADRFDAEARLTAATIDEIHGDDE